MILRPDQEPSSPAQAAVARIILPTSSRMAIGKAVKRPGGSEDKTAADGTWNLSDMMKSSGVWNGRRQQLATGARKPADSRPGVFADAFVPGSVFVLAAVPEVGQLLALLAEQVG